jgi:hypothetical protein
VPRPVTLPVKIGYTLTWVHNYKQLFSVCQEEFGARFGVRNTKIMALG